MSARGLRKEGEKKKENPRERIKDRGEERRGEKGGRGVKCMVEVNGGKYEKRGRN